MPAPQASKGASTITGSGGKCLAAGPVTLYGGTALQLYDCDGSASQNWSVASDGSLRSRGECMDVRDAGTVNGSQVQLFSCNTTPAQHWTYTSRRELVNPQSGRCLDADRLEIWDCTGGTDQKWTLPSP
ncbi:MULTISPECIES: RICIN domain-containing protein [Streptomyces]|uniref:RICIN domain-containing protein n=1 Tax=Streptomyces TaxID=1883 RepID=UPI000C589709|nr:MULTISPECIES: RICIN domain-containing protein [Streptomyces]PIB04749.1 hypothetical protein B1C81_31845 [Streptomyces sp. HG99]